MKTLIIKILSLFILISLFWYCTEEEDDRASYTDPGFFVTDYNILPADTLIVEVVVINTPGGFESIKATVSGQGQLSSPLAQPDSGNVMNGYARFEYYAPLDADTTIIEIEVTQLDSEEVYSKSIMVIASLPKIYNNIGHFLRANPKYSYLYRLAQKSSYWNPGEVVDDEGEIDPLASYGFSSDLWEVTFFAVPNEAFDSLIYLNPHIDHVNEADQEVADAIIGTCILGSRAKLSGGSHAISYDSLSQINPANPLINASTTRMLFQCGSMAFNLEKGTAGQISKTDGSYIPRCNFVKQDIKAGSSIIHALDGHFTDIVHFDGNVEPIKTWRSDLLFSILGWGNESKAGMNGFNGRDLFSGSGYWFGTMFVPLDSKIIAAYNNAWPEVVPEEEWTWNVRADIPQEQLDYMIDFWSNHNLEDVTDPTLSQGTYTTFNDKTLVATDSTVTVDGKTANILRTITFFDGGSDVPKVIHAIDAVLY